MTLIDTNTWYLVQRGEEQVTPPIPKWPPPGAWGRGDSVTGDCGVTYKGGAVDEAYENGKRAYWNGRFCGHGNGLGCEDCKSEVHALAFPRMSSDDHG